MTDTPDPTRDLWESVVVQLNSDDRITPQLHGFINLVEPKGVLGGTLYLEVPNDLTRGMLEQRIRVPLLNALSTIDEEHEVSNFAIVVNPEIRTAVLQPVLPRARRFVHSIPIASRIHAARASGAAPAARTALVTMRSVYTRAAHQSMLVLARSVGRGVRLAMTPTPVVHLASVIDGETAKRPRRAASRTLAALV